MCHAGDLHSIPGLGRTSGEGNGYPLQYSGLENSMDCVWSMGPQRVRHDWVTFTFHFLRRSSHTGSFHSIHFATLQSEPFPGSQSTLTTCGVFPSRLTSRPCCIPLHTSSVWYRSGNSWGWLQGSLTADCWGAHSLQGSCGSPVHESPRDLWHPVSYRSTIIIVFGSCLESFGSREWNTSLIESQTSFSFTLSSVFSCSGSDFCVSKVKSIQCQKPECNVRTFKRGEICRRYKLCTWWNCPRDRKSTRLNSSHNA